MIAGTIRRPCGIAADDRRRPAAGSEHPFESALVEAGRAPEVSTTRMTPRRIATSRISSAAQASIWSSLCSARRFRYRSGRPTGRSLPRSLLRGLVAEYARRAVRRTDPGQPASVRWSAPAARAASRDPSGQSLKRSVSQRPNRPGAGDVRGVGDQAVERRPAVAPVRPSTASRVGRPSTAIGSPTRTRTRPPKPQPARAVDRDRHERDAGAQREVGRALVERQRSDSTAWIRPSPAIATTPPAAMTALDPAGRLEQVVLAGLVRDRRARSSP